MNRYVEGPALQPLARLRRGDDPTPEERVRLGIYFSCLVNRAPAMRNLRISKLQSDLPGLLEKIRTDALRGSARQLLTPTGILQLNEIIDTYKSAGYDGLPRGGQRLLTEKIWVSERVTKLLVNMAWILLFTDEENPFVCSDNPVFWFRKIGMRARASEITVPLSSRVALLMVHLPQGAVTTKWNVASEVVDEVNHRTAAEASRFLYARDGGEWLKQIGEKRGEEFQTFR